MYAVIIIVETTDRKLMDLPTCSYSGSKDPALPDEATSASRRDDVHPLLRKRFPMDLNVPKHYEKVVLAILIRPVLLNLLGQSISRLVSSNGRDLCGSHKCL